MGDERRVPEQLKSEVLAAFAAVIDLSGAAARPGQAGASDSLRAAAVRHLSAALDIMRRGAEGPHA